MTRIVTTHYRYKRPPRRRLAEGATLKELAKSYNVGVATISRLAA